MEMTKDGFTGMLMNEVPEDCQPCRGAQFRAYQLTREVNAGNMLPDEAVESMQNYVESVPGYPCLGQTAVVGYMGGLQCGRSPLVQVAR